MSAKTLAQLRSSVRTLYGDSDGVTATDAEVDGWLKDGVDRVLEDCPWINVVLDATEALTTDAAGGVQLAATFNVGQIYSVEMRQSDGVSFIRLVSVHPGMLNNTDMDLTTSDGISGYYFDGTRIEFYPHFRSQSCTVRVVYSSDSIGSAFPTDPANALPAYFPRPGEEAAIRHAVAQLHSRDNNFEAAAFINQDVENWIRKCLIQHNRTERGEPLTVYNRDHYMLDADPSAW